MIETTCRGALDRTLGTRSLPEGCFTRKKKMQPGMGAWGFIPTITECDLGRQSWNLIQEGLGESQLTQLIEESVTF